MTADWQTFVAGVSKSVISLSVLPIHQRILPMSVIALLPALLIIVVWVIPQCQRVLDVRQGTVALERELDELHPFRTPQSKRLKDAWQLVVAKFPLWHLQHAEHRWLAGLVDLGTEHQLRTVKLKSTGGRGLPGITAEQNGSPVSATNLRVPVLTQQSFIWQVEGEFVDVLMVLGVLTSVATQIDEFTVERLGDGTAAMDSEPSDLAGVRADLKFRLYVREPSEPTDRVGMTSWPNPDAAKSAQLSRWRRVSALLSNAGEHSANCQSSAQDSLGFVAAGSLGIFLEDDVQNITLVGVIDTEAGSDRPKLRAVFRNGQGTFAIAALQTRLSAQDYRLVLLDRQRAVLQRPRLKEHEAVTQESIVLNLRPALPVAGENVVLNVAARRSQ